MKDPLSHAYVQHLADSAECFRVYDETLTGARIATRHDSSGWYYCCNHCNTKLARQVWDEWDRRNEWL